MEPEEQGPLGRKSKLSFPLGWKVKLWDEDLRVAAFRIPQLGEESGKWPPPLRRTLKHTPGPKLRQVSYNWEQHRLTQASLWRQVDMVPAHCLLMFYLNREGFLGPRLGLAIK